MVGFMVSRSEQMLTGPIPKPPRPLWPSVPYNPNRNGAAFQLFSHVRAQLILDLFLRDNGAFDAVQVFALFQNLKTRAHHQIRNGIGLRNTDLKSQKSTL